MLIVEGVSKSFSGHVALRDVSLEARQQKIFGLLGPNGAGKSTLIRIINSIILPDAGRVLWRGRPLDISRSALIGYLPEERGLYRKMKVGEQAVYLARLKGLSYAEARKRLEWWFARFDMLGWWDKRVEELSKGMAQRLQFVTTVVHDPELLIFDEPFSGFDPVNAERLKEEILGLRDRGATIIFSSHNMDSVERLCDDVALIDNGRVVLSGSVAEIRRSHSSGGYELKTRKEGVVTQCMITKDEVRDRLARAEAEGAELVSLQEQLPTMNEIFINTVNRDKAQ